MHSGNRDARPLRHMGMGRPRDPVLGEGGERAIEKLRAADLGRESGTGGSDSGHVSAFR